MGHPEAGRRLVLWALAALPFTARAASTSPPPPAGLQPRALVFPADHGAHPDIRIEWWYVTGWVSGADAAVGEGRCGFQVTFFRSRTSVPADHPSRFAAQQVIFAHAALTDLPRRRLLHDQRIARAGFGVAGAQVGDTGVTLRDWRFAREAHPDVPGGSRYRAQLASEAGGFGFDFTFDTTQPLLLQGDAGWSRKGPQPAQASQYYSQPQLRVAGTLTREGVRQAVQGRAWLDHEWSDSLLDPQAVGWDWVGFNLDDGSALTAFRLRDAQGGTVYAGGSFRSGAGALRNFAANEVAMTPGRRWVSPATRASYPVEWTLDTPAGRHRVVSLLDAQELDSRSSAGAVYWEGLSELRDAAGRRVGLGYLEMTGYAGRLSL